MTEKSVLAEPPKRIQWVVFFAALVFAPALVQALGLPLTIIAVPLDAALGASALVLLLAPFWGAETYLLIGAPLFALYLRFLGSNPLGLAVTGFSANLISIPLVYFDAELGGKDGMHMVRNVVGLGCFVAPIWGLVFGFIYRGWSND